MSQLKMETSKLIPDIDYGEINISREPGESCLTLSVRSPMIADYFEKLSGGKLAKSQFVNHHFTGYNPTGSLNVMGRYSFSKSGNPLVDDGDGNGPVLTFLLDPAIRDGLKIPIEYPLEGDAYARQLGEAVGRFLEDHLAPFRVGYRFFFQRG